MSALETLRVGIVVEQREIDNPWQDYSWSPVGVLTGITTDNDENEWKLLREGDGWSHFLVGSLDIELFRGETEGYRYNLTNDPPRVYVVLSAGEEADDPDVVPFLATICPYEAESYSENGEDIIEGVVMPDEIVHWVQAFIDKYHVDVPFKKRKQKKAYDLRKGSFERRPRVGSDVGGDGGG
jgi:hypothetical protein